MNKILVEVSVGELLDKISILEIKKDRIKDSDKLKFINAEYEVLMIPNRRGPSTEALQLYAESEESIERRKQYSKRRSSELIFNPPTLGRPDKKTRRLLLQKRHD